MVLSVIISRVHVVRKISDETLLASWHSGQFHHFLTSALLFLFTWSYGRPAQPWCLVRAWRSELSQRGWFSYISRGEGMLGTGLAAFLRSWAWRMTRKIELSWRTPLWGVHRLATSLCNCARLLAWFLPTLCCLGWVSAQKEIQPAVHFLSGCEDVGRSEMMGQGLGRVRGINAT